MYMLPLVLELREGPRPFFVLSFQHPGERPVPVGFVWTELEGDMAHDRARFAQLWGRPDSAWSTQSVEGMEIEVSAPRVEDLLPKVAAYLRAASEIRSTLPRGT